MKQAVVITGSSGGIGAAIVRWCLKHDFFVYGLDLRDSGFLDSSFCFIQTDITKRQSVLKAYQRVCQSAEAVYGLIHAAGIVRMGSFIEEDSETLQTVLDINVASMARVTRIFYPLLTEKNAKIIIFSSEYGTYCSIPFHGFYTASKHAVECFADSLRREVAPLGIRVSTIRPGAVNTNMTKGTKGQFDRLLETTEHFEKAYHRLYPLMVGATKNPISPDTIAEVVGKALSSARPRSAYPVHRDIRMVLLSHLPDAWIDGIFRLFL